MSDSLPSWERKYKRVLKGEDKTMIKNIKTSGVLAEAFDNKSTREKLLYKYGALVEKKQAEQAKKPKRKKRKKKPKVITGLY